MTILIVEDDIHKSKQLADFVRDLCPAIFLVVAHSFHSGLQALIADRPAFAILDMTLPTYDISDLEDGGRTRTYGGRDLLCEMQDANMATRAVIVTQFDTFGESGSLRTLQQVTTELIADFPDHFLGTIYYHPSRTDWRVRLHQILDQLNLCV